MNYLIKLKVDKDINLYLFNPTNDSKNIKYIYIDNYKELEEKNIYEVYDIEKNDNYCKLIKYNLIFICKKLSPLEYEIKKVKKAELFLEYKTKKRIGDINSFKFDKDLEYFSIINISNFILNIIDNESTEIKNFISNIFFKKQFIKI